MAAYISGLAKLREPFPPHQISKLPKPTAKRDVMDSLPKATCKECGQYHATSRVIHLDYVGHAALTDRLLDCDPAWAWEPLAVGDNGLPVLDGYGGMWIKLTVCGVTRMGYGHAGDKEGGDAIKEVIGDALRNAAMRFGAALELWHKGQLHVEEDPPQATKMAPAKIADWLQSIKTAGPDELDDIKKQALAEATAVKDADAFASFSAAAKKRRGEFPKVPA